jgi:hypothetical protein
MEQARVSWQPHGRCSPAPKNADAPAVKRENGAKETAVTGKNRIMIYGPKNDGTYIVEFRTTAGEALAISIPATETRVIRYFRERMAYDLFVPDIP